MKKLSKALMKVLSGTLATLLLATSFATEMVIINSSAAPLENRIMTIEQPDGKAVDVLVTGDEFYGRFETPPTENNNFSKYTLVKDDKSGKLCYADLDVNGDLVSTGFLFDPKVKFNGEVIVNGTKKTIMPRLKEGISTVRNKICKVRKAMFGNGNKNKQTGNFKPDELPQPPVASDPDVIPPNPDPAPAPAPVYTSSTSLNTTFSALKAFDGNTATMWKASTTTKPQWLKVDYGVSKNILQVRSYFETPTSAYKYKIETSIDNTTWTMYADKTTNNAAGNPCYIDTKGTTARFVRITVTGTATTSMYAALKEFSVRTTDVPMVTGANKVPTNVYGITLMIDFPDKKSVDPIGDRTKIDNMMNLAGGNSVYQYFYDMSNGKMTYKNYVAPFYTAKYTSPYYTDESVPYTQRAKELIIEALKNLEKTEDFSAFTMTDGRVYAVNAIINGYCSNNWAKGLWPHSICDMEDTVGLNYTAANGTQFHQYEISFAGDTNNLNPSTTIHENGHLVCRLADLYDYDGDSAGCGNWDLMSTTVADGYNAPLNPYYRDYLCGWGSMYNLNSPAGTTTITANSPHSWMFQNAANKYEFFLVEAVRKKGRRAALPGEGMLIWHIDMKKLTNFAAGANNEQQMTASQHYYVSLEQADGRNDLEKYLNYGDATDAFFAGNKNLFNGTSLPNSKWWNGTLSGFNASNISAIGDSMTITH